MILFLMFWTNGLKLGMGDRVRCGSIYCVSCVKCGTFGGNE